MHSPRASPEPALFVAPTKNTGNGLFTRTAIRKGETAFFMSGSTYDFESRTKEDAARYENSICIGVDRWLDPSPPYVFGNHSCNPNLGIRGTVELVALRGIKAGEELTYDYSITTDESLWTMECRCGSPRCRSTIRSFQFLSEEQYGRYFPYVGDHFQTLWSARPRVISA